LHDKQAGPAPDPRLWPDVDAQLAQVCTALLERDPAARACHRDIVAVLEAMPLRRAEAPPRTFTFVGRERELAALGDAATRAHNGELQSVLVSGTSGIGKSALLDEFCRDLEGTLVLRSRCNEREALPYKALDGLIDGLCRHLSALASDRCAALLPRHMTPLVQLFPVLGQVSSVASAPKPRFNADPRVQRDQAFAALKELLLRLCDRGPVALVVDDLQWGDLDSLRMLAHVLGPPDPPPLLLVAAFRTEDVARSPVLAELTASQVYFATPPVQLALSRLAPSEAAELACGLAEATGQQLSRELASALSAEADGVPFFIQELVRHVRFSAERAEHVQAGNVLSLEQVLLERIAAIPEDAQRLLQVLAIAAGPIEQTVALDAADLGHGNREAQFCLLGARLIRSHGTRALDTIESYHDRIRETVAAHLTDREAQRWHARIADAMTRHEIHDPERLVVHYAGAGDTTRAGSAAIDAAHAAAEKLAFNRAAELYGKALELIGADDALRRRLYEQLGDALANSGRGAKAAEAYLEAAVGLDGTQARRLQCRAAQQYLRSGRLEEGTSLTRRLLGVVGIRWPKGSSAIVGTLLWTKASIALRGIPTSPRPADSLDPVLGARLDILESVFREIEVVDPLRGVALQSRYLREAMRAREPYPLVLGLAWEAFNNAILRGTRAQDRVWAMLARTEELAQQVQTPYARATSTMARAGCAAAFGRFADALEPAVEALRIFRDQCLGTSWEQNLLTTFRLGAIEHTGSLIEIAREAPELARQARERDDHFSRGFLALSVPASCLMADDVSGAHQVLDEQRRALSGDFTSLHLYVVHRTVDLHLYCERGRAALTHHLEHWPAFRRSLLYRCEPFRVLGHWFLVRAALGAAQHEHDPQARRLARKHIAILERLRRPDTACFGLLARSGIARLEGQHELARKLLREAIRVCTQNRLDLLALYARYNLGIAMANAEGARLLQSADDELRKQGVVHPQRWVATYAPGFEL
jgi:tetratricopeptide (TPR) repeat protein